MAVGRPFRKRSVGCVGVSVIFVAALFAVNGLGYLIDCAFNPWAHSLTGRPTLVGTWVGRVTTPGGESRVLFLDMRRSTNARGNYSTCRTCPRIEGAAKLCGGESDVRPYDVWGGPDSWDGTRFHLAAATAKGRPPSAGLQAGGMRGEWSGDALSMTMELSRSDESGATHSRSGDPDVNTPAKFTMARGGGSNFFDECRKLGAVK